MISKCLILAVVLAVSAVRSVPVTQEEYARYISQQQIARLSDKPQPAARKPVLLQVLPPAYQPAARAAAYQQPQPQQAYPVPSYQPLPQAYSQQPEDYQEPEQQYQPPSRPQAAYPKQAPRPKQATRPSKQQEEEENDNDPNAQYQFSFDISDDESTNYHNRKETRDGQKITGSYSVVDSDGFIRTVTYTADPEEGFKAEVSREPTNIQVKVPTPTTASPAPQYRQAERKPQPQYITLPSNEQESVEQQPGQPISGYYRQAQPLLVKAPAHRFAVPRPQAGKANALGYATNPTTAPIIYQAYQQ
ncbi:cuticle protein 19.8 [Adelges cooleyi]|uniref:cuticle protein 19.8 n=1 Tax=Adelges cooleyi TaxID=133065 RepID=UPI00217FB9D8|nr:cuticle protein 19.8 [Adelges cooleyi]